LTTIETLFINRDEASSSLGNGEKRGKIDKMFFCCRLWQLFFVNITALSKIISIKLILKVEKILLRKYNMIFKAKDAGVNRKRKP
jgi:hypothetical protein